MHRRKPNMVTAEHRRLRRAFAAILVAVAPAAVTQACSGGPSTGATATGQDAGHDVHTDVEHDASTDAGQDATEEPDAMDEADGGDAGDGACPLTINVVDASYDDAGDPVLCSYNLPCGVPDTWTANGCTLYVGSVPIGCNLVADSGCEADVYVPTPGTPATIVCPGCFGGGGRTPRGLRRSRAIGAPTPEGAYFARMAYDEAASVHAFGRMHDELAALGAPAALQREASRAMRDEVRHARAMARHARARGAGVPTPRVRRATVRTLESIARENAVEGCVNETFGALLAAYQAEHAPSAAVRRTFARIAADEARHAALSWAVARWAEQGLDPRARARVAAARARALAALRKQAGASQVDAAVGRPCPAVRARLLDGMIQALALTAQA